MESYLHHHVKNFLFTRDQIKWFSSKLFGLFPLPKIDEEIQTTVKIILLAICSQQGEPVEHGYLVQGCGAKETEIVKLLASINIVLESRYQQIVGRN